MAETQERDEFFDAPSPSQAGIDALSAVIEDVKARRTADGRSFDDNGGASPRSARSHPLSITIPTGPSHFETAFTAMQYLPMPVIVIGPLKTVVLANDAMGRLLDYDPSTGTRSPGRGPEDYAAISEGLLGQTLSQVGVDMLVSGVPLWMNWERFLDSIGRVATDSESGTPRAEETAAEGGLDNSDGGDGGDVTPTLESLPMLTSANLNRQTVHDVSVDVVLCSQKSRVAKTKAGYRQISATMVVTAWTIEEEKYFTLMFTASSNVVAAEPAKDVNDVKDAAKDAAQHSSRNVHKPTRAYTNSSGSISSSSSSGRRHHGSAGSSVVSSPSTFTPSFPPNGPPSRTALSAAPTILQKATKLRDALLNAMDLPCYAVWRDMSVGIPNKALMRLAVGDDEATTEEEFMRHFICYTDDFSRRLDTEEYPIIILVRTRTRFQNRRIGMYDPKTGQPRIYDTNGEAIYDEHTGEFLGGVVVLKDVTEYLDRIAAQKKLTSQQFEYIAEMIPQLVWTTGYKGLVEWFSQRWYDYTGMTEEESINNGWADAVHPEDVPTTTNHWMHCMATGEPYAQEMRLKRRDGSYRWYLSQALPLRDERNSIVRWFGTCTDINEVVEARELAKQTRAQLLRVIETADVTLWSGEQLRTRQKGILLIC